MKTITLTSPTCSSVWKTRSELALTYHHRIFGLVHAENVESNTSHDLTDNTPITQVISLPLLGISVWSLLYYLRTDDFRFFVTIGGCVLALAFAHKLLVFVLTLILATATVGSYALRVSSIYQRRIRRLTALVGTTLAVQWAVLTAFAGKVVGLGGGLIVSILSGEFGLESSTESSHAVPAVDSTVISVIHNLHLLLFVAAALAGVALLIREIRQQTHPAIAVLLSAVLVLVG